MRDQPRKASGEIDRWLVRLINRADRLRQQRDHARLDLALMRDELEEAKQRQGIMQDNYLALTRIISAVKSAVAAEGHPVDRINTIREAVSKADI